MVYIFSDHIVTIIQPERSKKDQIQRKQYLVTTLLVCDSD